eukprot:NODE_1298_length_1199_cov_17.072174_g1067_i0.p1 GENE.NODE_1298_length_1199_cov_17.072174_g1067_i0~~NODE_1298_length_1199_cov_17.072174_g1067_i0.p1  ORF type:complete len:269 (+),score=53.75 NODE_1298_length_1199_cov_17.072174_g1067_i0:364-1170(+)
MYVPADPTDGGLPIGCTYAIRAPSKSHRRRLMYYGLPVEYPPRSNSTGFDNYAKDCEAVPAEAKAVARVLAEGAVVAIMRGQQAIGPASLGMRSLLTVPSKEGRLRIYNVSQLPWFRMPSCALPLEHAENVFESPPPSPHASFSARLRPEIRTRLPSLGHLDGTAQVQTVARGDNPWLHDILLHVGDQTKHSVLLTAPFGKPNCNLAMEAVDTLRNNPGITHLVVDNWLFGRQGVSNELCISMAAFMEAKDSAPMEKKVRHKHVHRRL